jgi:hypothetical protein
MIEPTNIGIGDAAHAKLKALSQDGYFAQMVDVYRFAIALALAYGVTPIEITGSRQNVFGVATVDPDKSLYTAIKTLIDTSDTPVYRWAERLADWGVIEISRRVDEGTFDIGQILEEAERLSEN